MSKGDCRHVSGKQKMVRIVIRPRQLLVGLNGVVQMLDAKEKVSGPAQVNKSIEPVDIHPFDEPPF